MILVPLNECFLRPTNPATFARGRSVYVYLRGTSEEAQLYADADGEEELDQPLSTDSGGHPEGPGGELPWIAFGSYDVKVGSEVFPWEGIAGTAFGEPVVMDLFGPEPRSSHALEGDTSVTTYSLFPADAFSASTHFLPQQATASVSYALWDVAYNPEGGKDCGIQLVSFKGNPEGVFNPITEFSGSSSSTPLHKQAIITSEIAELWEEAREEGDARFLGHRLKASVSPSVAPLVFMSRIVIVLDPRGPS